MSFEPAKAKLTIGSLDEAGLNVSAQYNPKELQVDQNVPWKKPEAAAKGGGAAPQGTQKDLNFMALEFTGAESRSMSVELLFDAFEPDRGPDKAGSNPKSVSDCVSSERSRSSGLIRTWTSPSDETR